MLGMPHLASLRPESKGNAGSYACFDGRLAQGVRSLRRLGFRRCR